MAGVVIHPEVLFQARVVRVLGAHAVEKMDGFAAAFQQAKRLGFQAKVQFAPGLLADPGNVFDTMPDIIANVFQIFAAERKTLEGARQRADAGFDSRRRELREQIEKQIGVGQPLRRGPVRNVNRLFNFAAVKRPKGKPFIVKT